jgi:hypothetical protein
VGGGKGFKPPYGFENILITTRSTIAVANNKNMLKISQIEIFIYHTLPFKVAPPCQELLLSVYPRFHECQAMAKKSDAIISDLGAKNMPIYKFVINSI